MQADYSVEIGGEAPALEIPWRSVDGAARYFDLHVRPELLLEIDEAQRFRELGEFLAVVNAPGSPLATAKCDVWATRELNAEEAIFGAPLKLASYVDLVFGGEERFSFPQHEEFARALCALLNKAPEMPSAAEFVIRRCYFHPAGVQLGATESASGEEAARETEPLDGYCVSFYLSGYGDEETDARQRWAIGMKLVQNAILQLSVRRSASRQQVQ